MDDAEELLKHKDVVYVHRETLGQEWVGPCEWGRDHSASPDIGYHSPQQVPSLGAKPAFLCLCSQAHTSPSGTGEGGGKRLKYSQVPQS